MEVVFSYDTPTANFYKDKVTGLPRIPAVPTAIQFTPVRPFLVTETTLRVDNLIPQTTQISLCRKSVGRGVTHKFHNPLWQI